MAHLVAPADQAVAWLWAVDQAVDQAADREAQAVPEGQAADREAQAVPEGQAVDREAQEDPAGLVGSQVVPAVRADREDLVEEAVAGVLPAVEHLTPRKSLK